MQFLKKLSEEEICNRIYAYIGKIKNNIAREHHRNMLNACIDELFERRKRELISKKTK